MKKIMVFGVFDGLHEGHKKFLSDAKALGDHLVAVISQDHIVERLKGRLPSFNLAERVAELKKEDSVNEVIVGDEELGSWRVVEKYQPDVLAVGNDQSALKESLKNRLSEFEWRPEIVTLPSYEINK